MKIESQVCTLEQAKRLNELGIRQGLSIFFWDSWNGGLKLNSNPMDGYAAQKGNTCFSAFTVAELGVMLSGNDHPPKKSKDDRYWYDVFGSRYRQFKTEAEGRAALLIYCLGKGIVKAEELNQRLQAA